MTRLEIAFSVDAIRISGYSIMFVCADLRARVCNPLCGKPVRAPVLPFLTAVNFSSLSA